MVMMMDLVVVVIVVVIVIVIMIVIVIVRVGVGMGMGMRMRMILQMHVQIINYNLYPGTRDSLPDVLFNFQGIPVHRKSSEFLFQKVRFNPKVDHGSQVHVT